MATLTLPEIPGISGDMIDAVASQAESDAELVVAFLDEIGLPASPDKPVGLPGAFLLDLGAALRMAEWERAGLRAHLEAGLAPACQALDEASRLLRDHTDHGPSLAHRVMVVFVERFAWHGRSDWNAAVVLDSIVDDAALDAVAEFLYNHRQAGAARRT
jgi:hypothetical protein